MNISFRPSPNYAALAEAAAGSEGVQDDKWIVGVRVRTAKELHKALQDALKRVRHENKGMFIEVMVD